MISMILGVDVTHPAINDKTHQQVKSLSDRWSKVWNWSEQRKKQLLKVLSFKVKKRKAAVVVAVVFLVFFK